MKADQLQKLEQRRQAFDQKRNDFLDQLAKLSEQDLKQPPEADRWSLLELAQHLMLGERALFQDLPDPAQMKGRPRSWRHRLMNKLVLLILRRGVRVKVPAASMEPDGKMSLEEIRRAWDESQLWLQQFIAELNADTINQAVFIHPVTGSLAIEQVVTLGEVHFDSHMKKVADRLQQLLREAK